MIVFRALTIAGLVLAAVAPSRAQDYPARPVTIVVPTGRAAAWRWWRGSSRQSLSSGSASRL